MADGTGIEWTDATWNPVRGCSRKSPGCGGPGPHGGCYAEIVAARFSGPGQPYEGLAHFVGGKPRWTGKLSFVHHVLDQPLRWSRPRKIFVNSMSDLFHESMPDEWIDQVFAVMALAPQHTFQVLTKRPERMATYLADGALYQRVLRAAGQLRAKRPKLARIPIDTFAAGQWHPNIWLGASVEDQQRADERRDAMQQVAELGWCTWVSYEPALGPVDWSGWEFLQWMVSGGESGPRSRPSHPDWHRDTRDWCAEHGIAFLFKQWGCWAPGESITAGSDPADGAKWFNEAWSFETFGRSFELHCDDEPDVWHVSKKRAGRHLDGKIHNGYPTIQNRGESA